uniref:Protein kinase domain-containing protein n=1 Tax=Macrostomum lignano TaxID=282301 RepID=A0A1I8GZ94_9PLAT
MQLCTEETEIFPGWIKSRHIARGAHSDVLEIMEKQGTERRAAKVIRLPVQLGEDQQQGMPGKLKEIFNDEKRLCKLEHENIVRFLDMSLVTAEPSVLVSMELIDGQTLESFINRCKPLDYGTVSQLAKQICSALSYLHTMSPRIIIHRDVNCRTIMVLEDNRNIKLIDFGLAVQLVESASDHVTGNPKGDPAFMAPELFLTEGTEDTPYSCTSDIWAFGCVIYQMVTGDRPHRDCKNMLAIVRRVKNQGAPPLPDNCPNTLKDFYRNCTAQKRDQRKSATELLKHPFLLHGRAIAGPSEPSTPTESPQDGAKLALMPDASSSTSDTFEMATREKGLCLIITVEQCGDTSTFPPSKNLENKALNIEDAFKKLSFIVEKYNNPRCTDFWRCIDNVVTSQDLADISSFVCFLIGHGTGGSVFASDGEEIEVRDIVARFRASQCPGLKDKPKIFFIQAEKQPEGLEACSLEESSFRLPEHEFLLCSGGSTGSLSDTVCSVIRDEKFSKEHIETVVAEVNRRLSLAEMKKGTERFGSGASAVTSLTKKFFLDGGSTEESLPASPDQWTDQQLRKQSDTPEKCKQTFGPMRQTPLMIACIKGKDEIVSEMLKKSLEIGEKDVQGRTALCWAAVKGHKSVLAAFSEAFKSNESALKAEINAEDNLRQTPLILAAKNNRTDVLEPLVNMGADINRQDAMRYSAILYAAKLGLELTARELCNLGANLKLADFSGNTPLIWAARCERLNKPDELDFCRREGERKMNAQQWAKFCEHYECATVLEKLIRRLANLSSQGVTMEQDEQGNGDQPPPPSGSGPGGSGREEEGATGGGEPNESTGGQEDSSRAGPYPMDGIHRGIALVINIYDFVGLDLPRRLGSMADMAENALYHCFTSLGFDCRQVQNVNAHFFDHLPANICSEEELRNSKAIIVCLMSHGGHDFIYSHDGRQVALQLIYSKFQLCQQLKDKPKLFFIQSCRDAPANHRLFQQVNQVSLEDCMYFYSTSPGRLSGRHPESGGLFTQQLCSVVADDFNQDREEFTAVVPRVINRVLDRSNGQQVPCCELTIRRPLKYPTLGMRQNAA